MLKLTVTPWPFCVVMSSSCPGVEFLKSARVRTLAGLQCTGTCAFCINALSRLGHCFFVTVNCWKYLKNSGQQQPQAKGFSTLTCCSAVRGVSTGDSSDWGTDQLEASVVAAAGQSHQTTVLFDQPWGLGILFQVFWGYALIFLQVLSTLQAARLGCSGLLQSL